MTYDIGKESASLANWLDVSGSKEAIAFDYLKDAYNAGVRAATASMSEYFEVDILSPDGDQTWTYQAKTTPRVGEYVSVRGSKPFEIAFSGVVDKDTLIEGYVIGYAK